MVEVTCSTKFTDEMEAAMSTQRQIEKLRAPIIAAAVKAAGKPVELIEAPNYNHVEMCEAVADLRAERTGSTTFDKIGLNRGTRATEEPICWRIAMSAIGP